MNRELSGPVNYKFELSHQHSINTQTALEIPVKLCEETAQCPMTSTSATWPSLSQPVLCLQGGCPTSVDRGRENLGFALHATQASLQRGTPFLDIPEGQYGEL